MANKNKKYFLILCLVQISFAWLNIAYAQTGAADGADSADYRQFKVQDSIQKYLCTPTEADTTKPGYNDLYQTDPQKASNQASGDLYNCINRLYKFAIAIGASLGVFFIVIAGYIYIDAGGNEESVTKAKGILTSTIAAMVILFSGYILLKAINPELIQFKPIQPKSVLLLKEPTGTTGGVKSNFCQTANSYNCNEAGTAQTCSQYDSFLSQYGSRISGTVNGSSLLKAVMYHESRCKTDLVSSADAYGLMQMKIPTANTFKDKCGITGTIDANWFKNNPGPSICLAAEYLKYLNSSCGSDVGKLLTGYATGNCNEGTACPTAVSEMLACYSGPPGASSSGNPYVTPLSSTVKEAAQKILNLDNKGLVINKTDCDCPGNCPINSLQSISKGEAPIKDGPLNATPPNKSCNNGTVSTVSLSMLNGILLAANNGSNFVINSLTGGHHSNVNDTHYQGRAADLTPVTKTSAEQTKLVSSLKSSQATSIALECDINGSHIYKVFGTAIQDSDPMCMSKPGYHIHVEW